MKKRYIAPRTEEMDIVPSNTIMVTSNTTTPIGPAPRRRGDTID